MRNLLEEIRALFEQRDFRAGEGMLVRSLLAQLGHPRGDRLETAVQEAVSTGEFYIDGDWLKRV